MARAFRRRRARPDTRAWPRRAPGGGAGHQDGPRGGALGRVRASGEAITRGLASPSTRSTPRAACSAAASSSSSNATTSATRRRARLPRASSSPGEGRGPLRRDRHAGVLAIVPLVNKEKMPFIGVWAAGTGITRNGANPNYVFRVSAVDEGRRQAPPIRAEEIQREEAGLMLINNPWGESNEKGLIAAARRSASRSPASRNSRTTTSTWSRS